MPGGNQCSPMRPLREGIIDYVDPFSIQLEPGTKPSRQRTRPLTPVQVETLKQQLADLSADDIIAPSASSWAYPWSQS